MDDSDVWQLISSIRLTVWFENLYLLCSAQKLLQAENMAEQEEDWFCAIPFLRKNVSTLFNKNGETAKHKTGNRQIVWIRLWKYLQCMFEVLLEFPTPIRMKLSSCMYYVFTRVSQRYNYFIFLACEPVFIYLIFRIATCKKSKKPMVQNFKKLKNWVPNFFIYQGPNICTCSLKRNEVLFQSI